MHADFIGRIDYVTDEMCQMNTRIGRIARRQAHIGSYDPSPSPSLEASPDDESDDDEDDVDSSNDDEMTTSQCLALSFMTKRGSSFGFESSLVRRGKVSIEHFFDRGSVYIFLRDVVRFICIFLFFFIYISLLYTGLVTIYLHTLYFTFIYMMMMYVFLHLSLHVLFLFSLYTHVSLCMQSLFLFHT